MILNTSIIPNLNYRIVRNFLIKFTLNVINKNGNKNKEFIKFLISFGFNKAGHQEYLYALFLKGSIF